MYDLHSQVGSKAAHFDNKPLYIKIVKKVYIVHRKLPFKVNEVQTNAFCSDASSAPKVKKIKFYK